MSPICDHENMPKKLSRSQQKIRKGIDALTEWAENKGYEVHLEANRIDEVRRLHKEIYISTRQPLYMQLFGLAHECGHVTIEHNLERYKKRYPRNYEREMEGKKNRQWSKISLHQELAEECEAWQKGEELLNKLNVKFDKEKFDKVAADCVFTYIKSAAE